MPILGINMPKMGMNSTRPTAPASLADAIFSGTQQRVLGLLFGHPQRSFYATELIGLTGAGSGAVQRELARLAQSGLVTVHPVGNQKHYQADPKSPIFAELCSVMQKTVGLAEPLRAALMGLEKKIKAAFVYGSVARRQDTGSSDIDLMLISDKLTYPDVFAAVDAASVQLGRSVNPTIYTGKEFSKRIAEDHVFVKRVLARPKIWLFGGENNLIV